MARLSDTHEDVEKVFSTVLEETTLPRFIDVKILSNNRQRSIGKVIKASDVVKHMTKKDVVIIVNEEIFDKLDDKQQRIVAEELIAQIYFDSERDAVKILKPDISVHSGVLKKYGYDEYIRTHESIKAAYAQLEELQVQA